MKGNYDAGATVTLKIVVATNERRASRRLAEEPKFDVLLPPFPSVGIGGTFVNVAGINFDNIPVVDDSGKIVDYKLPRFTVGGLAVDPATVTHPNGTIYRFPIPGGLAPSAVAMAVARLEASAVQELAARFGPAFDRAVELVAGLRGQLIVSGVGKSGLVAQRIAATLTEVDCGGTTPKDPGRVTIRRLNRAEYNNTIRDLCGVDFKPAADFPADDVGYGFDNIGDVLSFQPILLEKYLAAADKILDAAIKVAPGPPKR